MEQQQQTIFIFTNHRAECKLKIVLRSQSFDVWLEEKYEYRNWQGSFNKTYIQQLTQKSGRTLSFSDFKSSLIKAFQKQDQGVYSVDVLTSQDLENLKSRKTGAKREKSKSNKRYIILSVVTEQNKMHYPLPLTVVLVQHSIQHVKALYLDIRSELDRVKAQNLQPSRNQASSLGTSSFSINYDKRNAGPKHYSQANTQNLKEINQLETEREILKNKLKRLEEQSQLKKGGVQTNTIILKTQQLRTALQTPNLALVEARAKAQQLAETHAGLIKELMILHASISKLLTTEKQVKIRKHNQEITRQLENARTLANKNSLELDRLKKLLEKQKAQGKELELKHKKMLGEKDAKIRNKRNGPYSSYSLSRKGSSSGSVASRKSAGSFHSY